MCLFSDHGKIIKTVNADSSDSSKTVSSVVIEELDVLSKNEPIRKLEIVRTMQYGKIFLPLFYKTKTIKLQSEMKNYTIIQGLEQ